MTPRSENILRSFSVGLVPTLRRPRRRPGTWCATAAFLEDEVWTQNFSRRDEEIKRFVPLQWFITLCTLLLRSCQRWHRRGARNLEVKLGKGLARLFPKLIQRIPWCQDLDASRSFELPKASQPAWQAVAAAVGQILKSIRGIDQRILPAWLFVSRCYLLL